MDPVRIDDYEDFYSNHSELTVTGPDVYDKVIVPTIESVSNIVSGIVIIVIVIPII